MISGQKEIVHMDVYKTKAWSIVEKNNNNNDI
jgi:hypothetical protein